MGSRSGKEIRSYGVPSFQEPGNTTVVRNKPGAAPADVRSKEIDKRLNERDAVPQKPVKRDTSYEDNILGTSSTPTKDITLETAAKRLRARKTRLDDEENKALGE